MATVRGRKRADGTPNNTAQIRIKKNGAQVYTESQTFARKKAAKAWAKRRETELSEPGALQRANKPKSQLKDVIKQYLEEVGKAQPLGRTKPRKAPWSVSRIRTRARLHLPIPHSVVL